MCERYHCVQADCTNECSQSRPGVDLGDCPLADAFPPHCSLRSSSICACVRGSIVCKASSRPSTIEDSFVPADDGSDRSAWRCELKEDCACAILRYCSIRTTWYTCDCFSSPKIDCLLVKSEHPSLAAYQVDPQTRCTGRCTV